MPAAGCFLFCSFVFLVMQSDWQADGYIFKMKPFIDVHSLEPITNGTLSLIHNSLDEVSISIVSCLLGMPRLSLRSKRACLCVTYPVILWDELLAAGYSFSCYVRRRGVPAGLPRFSLAQESAEGLVNKTQISGSGGLG